MQNALGPTSILLVCNKLNPGGRPYKKTVLPSAGNVEFTGVRELNISPTSLAAG